MTQPLALLVYEELMPGSQLINRLVDLGYRVQTLTDAGQLVATAERDKPLVVLLDLASKAADVCAVLRQLKANSATAHLPVLAFTTNKDEKVQTAAHQAGAKLVASDQAVSEQLPLLLQQVLDVE
jgi:CheY-like chemotaxis protein